MQRPTTSSDDDFSFDFGGSEELFPLDSFDNDEKKPKGVKGYFKNTIKSLGHLGAKVAKDLYPEAFNFKDSFFEGSTDGEKININSYLKNIKSEVKKYSKLGVDVFKEVKSDVKKGLLTGDFTEDPNAGLEAFLGGDMGFDFDGGFDDYDTSDFDSNESDIKDDSGETKKSKLSTSEAVIKSNYASAKTNVSIGQKQVEATLGATQSHIRHENLLFSQQMDIFQEQHRQKMAVMKNIAINLSKVVTQNNLSNRAQMEYSAKSLAFSQDLASMIKEIRSVQWKLVTPKKPAEAKQNEFQRIVNGGFNLKFLTKELSDVVRSGPLGMILDLKESLDMGLEMGDMMGGPAAMAKMMIGDTLRQSVINRLISGNTKNKLSDLNLKMEGLSGAINRKLGDIANIDSYKVGEKLDNSVFGKILSKLPGGQTIGNFIKNEGVDLLQDKANILHKDDSTISSTNRYRMGDSSTVHPFDNKAHKALTEVIPGFLSKMEAGINHHDELYYDYGSEYEAEGFRTKKSMLLRYKEDQQAAYENLEGVREVRDLVNTHSKNNGIELSNEDTDTIIKNILKSGTTIKKIREDAESGKIDRLLDGLSVTDDDKEIYSKTIASALKDLDDPTKRNGDDNYYVKFSQAMDKYQHNLSRTNMENEERFSDRGSSAAFAEIVGNEQVERDISNTKKKLKKVEEKFKEETNPRKKDNYKREIESLTARIRDLERSKFGKAEMTNSTISNFSIDKEGRESLEDYAIKDLSDDSTHGFVKNIYNLLLEGIDVYTHAGESEEHKKQINTRKTSLRNSFTRGLTEVKISANEAAGYEEFDIGRYFDDLEETDEEKRTSDEYYARTNKMRLYQKTGEDYTPIPDSAPLDRNQTYYYKRADMSAIMAVKRRQETKRNNVMNDPSKGFFSSVTDKLKEIPILGKIIPDIPDISKYTGGLDSVISTITGVANSTIGTTLYGEDFSKGNEDVEKIKNKASAIKKDITESKIYNDTKDKVSEIKKDITDSKIYNDAKNKVSEIKNNVSETASKIKTELTDENKSLSEKAKDLAIGAGNSIKNKASDIKDDITDSKIYNDAKNKVSDIKKDITDSKIYNDTKEKANKAKDFIKKKSKTVFDRRISSIKIGKMTVAQHLESIQSKELIVKLENANGTRAKITVLREYGTEKTRGLAEALENELKKPGREILDDAKSGLTAGALLAGGSILGGVAAAVTGGKTIFDKVKSKIVGNRPSDEVSDELMSENKQNYVIEDKKEDKVRGDSAEEQQAMAKEREQEKREVERNSFLGTIAAFFKKADKEGLDLSKKTLEEQKENFEEASSEGTGDILGSVLGPILHFIPGGDKIASVLQFTGLVGGGGGATALGIGKKGLKNAGKHLLKGDVKGAKNSLKATKTVLKKGFKIPNNLKMPKLPKIGGIGKTAKMGASAAKGGKLLGVAKSVVQAPGKALKGYSNLMKTSTKALASGTEAMVKGGGVITGALKKLFTAGPIGKKLSQSGAGRLIGWITKGITKAAGKVATKVTAFMAQASSVVGLAIPLTLAVKDFVSGITNCKSILKVGKGVKIKFGMKLACGLAQALDGFLLGIPGILAKFFGYDTLFNAIYDLIGSREEKAALERYKIYNNKRAQVLGVKDAEKLSVWENKNTVGNKALRNIGHFLTGGLISNSDEKDSKTLGFKTPTIYKYWKKNRYDPIMELYDDIAKQYGGRKVVEAMNDDKVKSNEEDENTADQSDEENQKIAQAIENQNKFRKEFLQAAIAKVKELGVAWLTADCTPELFEKFTGKSAGYKNTFQKIKAKQKENRKALTDGAKKLVGKVTSMFGGGVKKAAKAITAKARVAKDWLVKNVSNGVKSYFGLYKKAGKAVVKGVQKASSYVFNKSKEFSDKVKKFAGSLTGKLKEILNKMFDFYNYSDNTKKVMTQASDTIGSFFSKFTNESGISVSDVTNSLKASAEKIAGVEMGGDPAGESAARIGNESIKEAIKTKLESIGNERNKYDNASFGKNGSAKTSSSLRSSKNNSVFKGESAAAEFVTKFSEEMTEKLAILDKIHEEQMKHNNASEEFFVACLKMMSQISKNIKNPSMTSQIDQMVQIVSR